MLSILVLVVLRSMVDPFILSCSRVGGSMVFKLPDMVVELQSRLWPHRSSLKREVIVQQNMESVSCELILPYHTIMNPPFPYSLLSIE